MKKLSYIFVASILLFLSLTGYANEIEISNVSGAVFAGGKLIEGASVKLLRSNDSSVLKSTVTDQSGSFHFQQQTEGKFLVAVQFVGFEIFYSETFELNENILFYQLKLINLVAGGKQLNAVTVTGKKPFIE